MQFVGLDRRPVANRSRRVDPLPTVHFIDDANPRNRCIQESTMNRTIAAQAVSFSLALAVTVSTLMGLNVLASSEHAMQQQQVAAAKAPQA
jgi:hypothetical protein